MPDNASIKGRPGRAAICVRSRPASAGPIIPFDLPAIPETSFMQRILIRIRIAAVLAGTMLMAGCSEPEVVESEPRRADDQITQRELDSFLGVIDSLAEKKLPAMPTVILPAPQWSRNRSLPVNELVEEEVKMRADRSSIDWLAAHCPQSRFLKRALRREKMTIEQFVGLYLALGESLCRDCIPDGRDLEDILVRGKRVVADLKKDHRTFSSLPEDQAFFLQQQSGWLAVVDRAARLKPVHPENLALVRRNHDRLAAVMPREFMLNPLLEFATILDDRGVPFQEPVGQETDDRIVWSRDQALIGTDAADEGEAK